MPTIYITSGTLWIAPADFSNINTVECYGGGADGGVTTAGAGGGGAAYAKTTNLNINAGSNVTIHIGSAGARDTYFNATSLANAVSNGTGVSCGAQGATGSTGGASGSSCGTTKFSGGAGGTSNNNGCGGGGGGGAAGPNGAGASGGNSPFDSGGGGGGGANNGSAGTSGTSGNVPGHGGNGRGGTGGGAFNGGNATANSGGGGGPGYPTAGKGALDNVYGDGVHGPGGGGGGGSANFASYPGGDAGGFGGGGGGGSTYSSTATGAPGQSTDGLIVITYVSFLPSNRRSASVNVLTLRAPAIRTNLQPVLFRRDNLTPTQNMSWYRQPIALLHPPQAWVFQVPGQSGPPFPNPLPLFKNPFQTTPDIIIPRRTLDTRQQFPGKAPQDFHLSATEDADTFSLFAPTTSPINADITEIDSVTSFTLANPIKGSAEDIVNRVKLLLPKGWWKFHAPIRDAILGGIADLASWSYSLFKYAKLQTRVAWATDIWLDIISRDYFGTALIRKTNEPDGSFRTRIQKELIRERVTRKGMIDAVEDLTSLPATVFEPWNTGDTGAWDNGTFAFDIAGGWGDYLPAQAFLNVTPPGVQGIAGIGGWDSGYLAWDGGVGMWADMSLITGAVTTQDIYDTINKTRPTGVIVWTQLFPAAKGVPPPAPPTLTPLTIPPCMIQQTISPPPRVQATMPQTQIEGSYAVNPVTPSREPPWLNVQPPIPRPATAALQTWEPVGFGGFQAVNPVTPSVAPPWLDVQPPVLRASFQFQSWEPIGFGAGRATDPAAVLSWLPTLPVVKPNPAAYSIPVSPDSV